MNFYRNYARQGRRGDKSPHKQNSPTAIGRGILTALAVCVSVGVAHAEEGVPVSDCRLETLVTVLRPIAQKFEIPFDDLLDSPILTLRAGAPSLIDLTGSIPDFRFDIAAPKHVDLTTWTLTSLTPPETTAFPPGPA